MVKTMNRQYLKLIYIMRNCQNDQYNVIFLNKNDLFHERQGIYKGMTNFCAV